MSICPPHIFSSSVSFIHLIHPPRSAYVPLGINFFLFPDLVIFISQYFQLSPHPNKSHHIQVISLTLKDEMRFQMLICYPIISFLHTIHLVDHRSEVVPHIKTVLKTILCLLISWCSRTFFWRHTLLRN